MSFAFEAGESIVDGVRRIACEQIDHALGEMADDQLEAAQAAHQARKRCKKLRALLRLCRGSLGDATYHRENEWFRDAARLMQRLRDADAAVGTGEALAEAAPELHQVSKPLHEYLVARRLRIVAAEAGDDRRREFAARLQQARERVPQWRLSATGFDAVAGGLRRTGRRARHAMAAAFTELVPAAFHNWRKRVKYHGLHLRLLARLWPGPMRASRKECDRLGHLLGRDHDLFVLRQIVVAATDRFDDDSIGAVVGGIERQRALLQLRARRLGRRLHVEKTSRWVDRIGAYWRAFANDD